MYNNTNSRARNGILLSVHNTISLRLASVASLEKFLRWYITELRLLRQFSQNMPTGVGVRLERTGPDLGSRSVPESEAIRVPISTSPHGDQKLAD